MKIGSLFNTDVHVSIILLIMVAVAVFLGNGAELATIFFILLFHEMAHVGAAKLLNMKVKEIELLPFGGAIRIESLFELNPTHEIYIALAGPAANIFLILGYSAIQSLGIVSAENNRFLEINLILAAFNLLPALPLDGGRVLRAILAREVGMKKATNIAVYGGLTLSLFFVMTGIYALYYKIFNPTFFIMAGFLSYSALKEKKTASYMFIRDITYKRDFLIKEGLLNVKEIVALYDTPLKQVMRKFSPYRYHNVKVVDERLQVLGSLNENQIIRGMMDYGIHVPIGRLLRK